MLNRLAFALAAFVVLPGENQAWSYTASLADRPEEQISSQSRIEQGGSRSHKLPAGTDLPEIRVIFPTVTSVEPNCGTSAGGRMVTITGTGFYNGASVLFDNVAATDVTVVNSTTITARTPAHAPGSVTVTVSYSADNYGSKASAFAYGVRGDSNGDCGITVADVFYLTNFLFAGGSAPLDNADANSDGESAVSDVFFLVNFLFAGGPAPQ